MFSSSLMINLIYDCRETPRGGVRGGNGSRGWNGENIQQFERSPANFKRTRQVSFFNILIFLLFRYL